MKPNSIWKKPKFLITLAIIAFIGIVCGMQIYAAAVAGNKSEMGIKAEYKNGRNILGQFTAKLAELAQVREMATSDQERIIAAVFGEGGRAGNQAAWQWVQEQNPNADITIAKQMATIVDASRNKFANHQTAILARCQSFEVELNAPIGQLWYWLAGYPDKNVEKDYTLAKMCTPIESSHSAKAFESGIDDGFQFQAPPKKG